MDLGGRLFSVIPCFAILFYFSRSVLSCFCRQRTTGAGRVNGRFEGS